METICDTYRTKKVYTMAKNTSDTISEILRRAIRESDLPMFRLEKETGVQRMSIIRFVDGSQSLRLDKADALAEYFGLALSPTSRARKEK